MPGGRGNVPLGLEIRAQTCDKERRMLPLGTTGAAAACNADNVSFLLRSAIFSALRVLYSSRIPTPSDREWVVAEEERLQGTVGGATDRLGSDESCSSGQRLPVIEPRAGGSDGSSRPPNCSRLPRGVPALLVALGTSTARAFSLSDRIRLDSIELTRELTPGFAYPSDFSIT